MAQPAAVPACPTSPRAGAGAHGVLPWWIWGPMAAPVTGSGNLFAGVAFFGPQAGLISTDLLRDHVVTLDDGNAVIHRTTPDRFSGE